MLEMGRWSLDGEVNHGMEKGYSLFLDRKRSDQNMYIDIFKWRKQKLEEFCSFDQDLLTEGEARLSAKNQEVGLN